MMRCDLIEIKDLISARSKTFLGANFSKAWRCDVLLRRISTRRIIQRIRRETELSMRSLSVLLSQRALEKVESNSTFSRRRVSHIALNQSGMQEAVHMSLAFRDCVAGSFRRKRRQNSLQRGNEKKTFA